MDRVGANRSNSESKATRQPLPSDHRRHEHSGRSDGDFQASLLPQFHTNLEAEAVNLQQGVQRSDDIYGLSTSLHASDSRNTIRKRSQSHLACPNQSSVSQAVTPLPSGTSSRESPSITAAANDSALEEGSATDDGGNSAFTNTVPLSRSRASTYQSTQRYPINTRNNGATLYGDSPLATWSPQDSSMDAQRYISRRDNSSTEVMVPPWQPDSSVTLCPICGTQFSFFVRKHHCRKCGRVVCSSCSPHRITIPYQYIVQPPSDIASGSTTERPVMDHARANSSVPFEGVGGGERVRLCNPCVPDPNTAPPQALSPQLGALRAPRCISSNHSGGPATNSIFSGSGPYTPTSAFDAAIANFPRHPRQPIPHNGHNRSPRSNTASRGPSHSNDLLRPDGLESRSRSSTVGTPRDTLTMGQFLSTSNPSDHRPGQPSSSQHHHYRSLIPPDGERPLPQPPRPIRPPIPEEDECWVCHRELPSRSLDNFEALREAHVAACITEAMGQPSPSLTPAPARPSPPPPATVPTAALYAPRNPGPFAGEGSSSSSSVVPQSQTGPPLNTPEARMAAREQAHAAVVLGHSQRPSSPVRRTGVFPYQATEKDCVDDAECTICLEEFEVGVEMGRLECFCRFHLSCIRDWFATRPGQCPVHQHGGGY